MKSGELLMLPSSYEIAVLSCCLNSEDGRINSCVGDAINAGVKKEMFTDKRDQRLWEVLVHLYYRDPCACSFLHVYDHLMSSGTFDTVGGMDHVKDILDKCDVIYNFPNFLSDFLKHHTRKAAYVACQEHMARLLSDFSTDIYEMNDKFAESLMAMTRHEGKKIVYSPREFTDLMEEQIRAEASNDIRYMGLRTNMAEIDRCFPSGIAMGSMVVVGAAPSVGKTVFGLNMLTEACAVAREKNVRGIFFSAEMLPKELASRQWKSALKVSSVLGKPESEVLCYCSAMRATFEDSKLYAVDATNMKIGQVISTARRLHASEPVKVICFDYLQKLPTEMNVFNREREVATWVSAFKQLATELECVVVVLSQLNRSARNEKRYPITADLRDSGQIEQDADVIILIDEMRDDYGTPINSSAMRVKPRWVQVAKNRNGARGQPMLALMADCFKFVPAKLEDMVD